MKVLICRADEVESILLKMEIDSVLSIEHPNSVDGMGRAPRLENVEQKIISFWDTEEEGVEGGPSKDILNDSLYFLDQRINENIVVHCKGGRSRSVAIVLAWLVKHKGISTGIETVKSMRKEASPNMEVVRIADKLFDLHGVLVQSVLEDPVFQKNSVMVKEKRRRHLLLKN